MRRSEQSVDQGDRPDRPHEKARLPFPPLEAIGSADGRLHAHHREGTIAHQRNDMKRFLPAVLSLAVLVGACGGGEMTLPEYIDELNSVVGRAVSQADGLYASPVGAVMVEGAQLTDFTPHDLQIALERIADIEREIGEATASIEPPEVAREFHDRSPGENRRVFCAVWKKVSRPWRKAAALRNRSSGLRARASSSSSHGTTAHGRPLRHC